jgi:endonuclease YncB( thermonuclease family)|tara:strand:+ start:9 stop:512 length:504 start_codon:yes stop_codon:yes gene_type:complete
MFLNKRKTILVISVCILVLFLTDNDVKSQDIKISDGDTIKINGVKIRFSGIDAPESYFLGKKQTCKLEEKVIFCGEISKNKLIKKIGNNSVDCILEKNKDKYKRSIGECFVKGESLSVYMVRNGYALDWPRYSKGKFSKEQEFAKDNKLGIWAMKFEFPWVWRANNR